MSKRKDSVPSYATVFCGIDVSAATLAVAVQQQEKVVEREFPNSVAGHRQLTAWLGKRGGAVRVTLEATGIYSLDVALALDAAGGIEVEVLNPEKASSFAKTFARSRTDRAAAQMLAEYSRRMPFVPWQRPAGNALQLRTLGRHLVALGEEHTRLLNRRHAARGARHTPSCVRQDIQRALASLEKRMLRLRCQAQTLIELEPDTSRKFRLLLAIPGIAHISAIQILAELGSLDPQMSVRQWVAHSGLDPEHHTSGTSVHKPSRISRQGSRYLRRALYMPALVAVRHDPHFQAFYLALQQRHKTKLQAIVAVSRKLLHAIFGIFKTATPYDGAKLFPNLIPTS